MFSVEERNSIRNEILEYAASDSRIRAAAVTGSAAEYQEDDWSDIDLAFGVSTAADVAAVIADWTAHMYDRHGALHHLDVIAGAWVYRVFLLANTLQVDLAFVVETEFRALGPTFRLLYGSANEAQEPGAPQVEWLVGMAWLYALHARSCIARGKLWQAEYMVSGVRDQALALVCVRHGLTAAHGRGLDLLPRAVTAAYEETLIARLGEEELRRAFRNVLDLLVDEIDRADAGLGGRLGGVLRALGSVTDR